MDALSRKSLETEQATISLLLVCLALLITPNRLVSSRQSVLYVFSTAN